MLHPDAVPADRPIPPEGAIDEAVETAKTFCGADAPGFVNGILAAALREARQNAQAAMSELDTSALDDLVARLERAAEQLRSGELSADAAAGLVEDCAALAAPGRRRARPPGPRRRAGSPLPGPGHAPVSGHAEPRHRPPPSSGSPVAVTVAHTGRTPTRCATRSRATSPACASPPWRRPRPAWRRRCATRCWPAASASARARAGHGAAPSGADPREVLPLAAAIELVHTYSLIHDDLPAMDDDDLRRGRPTCHVKFGEDVAILAGDALYAEAFRHLLRRPAGEPPERVLAAARELAAATGVDGMVGGQYLDVRELARTPDELRALHELKTGRLIGASVACVLLLVGLDEAATDRLPPLRGGAGRALPDRRRHPRCDRDGGRARQAAGQRRAPRQAHVRQRVRARRGARARPPSATRKARATLAEAAPEGAAELEQITDFIFTRTT